MALCDLGILDTLGNEPSFYYRSFSHSSQKDAQSSSHVCQVEYMLECTEKKMAAPMCK